MNIDSDEYNESSRSDLRSDPRSDSLSREELPSKMTDPRLPWGKSLAPNGKPMLNIVLFEPEIPHNTGTTGRTCVSLGAKLWLVRPFGFQLSDQNLKRAGLDYWPYLEWEAVDCWDRLMDRIAEEFAPKPPRFWFLSKKATRIYTNVSYKQGDFLIFGSESRGLPDFVFSRWPNQCLKIPMAPQTRSLNLAVSVGITAFEAVRQIRLPY